MTLIAAVRNHPGPIFLGQYSGNHPEPAYMRGFMLGKHNADDRVKAVYKDGKRVYEVDCGRMPSLTAKRFIREIMRRKLGK